jgi:hypothetical protein
MSKPHSSLKKIKKLCACGASGCVIYPGIECGESKCLDKPCEKPVATKFFVNDDKYIKEMKVFDKNDQQLKKIDGAENYFLSSYKNCGKIEETADIKSLCRNIPKKKVNKVEIDEDEVADVHLPKEEAKKGVVEENNDWQIDFKNSNEKRLREETPTQFYNSINFSYLGTPMHYILPFLTTIEEIKQFFISLKNVFEGIKILNEAEIYHCDIKPQNLVLDDVDKKFKIIDFGQAIFKGSPEPQTNDFKQWGDYITGYTAGFVSPEYFFILNTKLYPDVPFFGDKDNFDYVKTSEFKKSSSSSSQKSSSSSQKSSRSSQKKDNKYIIVRRLKSFTKEKNELHKYNIVDIKPANYYDNLSKDYPSKTYIKNDIWSLGCVLRYVRSELLGKYQNAKGHLRLFLLNVIVDLSLVLTKLVILDVDKRPTPSEALKLYNVFLGKMTRDFNSTRKGGRKTRKRLTRKKRKIY